MVIGLQDLTDEEERAVSRRDTHNRIRRSLGAPGIVIE
jgi:hypothetical protein